MEGEEGLDVVEASERILYKIVESTFFFLSQ